MASGSKQLDPVSYSKALIAALVWALRASAWELHVSVRVRPCGPSPALPTRVAHGDDVANSSGCDGPEQPAGCEVDGRGSQPGDVPWGAGDAEMVSSCCCLQRALSRCSLMRRARRNGGRVLLSV